MSTKIHTASVSETQVLEVFLSGGQEGDAPAGEELLEEVRTCEEVEAVGGDRAYGSDAIRAVIAAAGKEAVIPPRSNRLRPAAYDKEKYKQRNKAERLFNKLKRLPRRGHPLRQTRRHVPWQRACRPTGGEPQMYREHALGWPVRAGLCLPSAWT